MAIDGPDDQMWRASQPDYAYPGGSSTFDETTPTYQLPPVNVVGQRPPPDPSSDGPITTYPDIAKGPTNNGIGGVMDFIKGLFPGAGDDTFGFGGINPNMIPFLASAWNQYNNSGKYMDMATKYADQMNPFGKERGFYQDKLRSLETDPNAYLASSPDYQAALRQGLGAVDRSSAAQGFGNSGTATADVMAYASDLGAKYLDRDRQSLMHMAGADIGPSAAAGLIETGLKGSIDSQNQALASLAAAFTKPDPRNGGGPGGGPGDGGGPIDWGKVLTSGGPTIKSAADAAKAVAALVSRGWSKSDAMAAIKAMMTGTGTNWTQNGDPYDPITNPDGYHPYPTEGEPVWHDGGEDSGGGWTPGYDLPGGGDGTGEGGWVSGSDLPTGDTYTTWWMGE